MELVDRLLAFLNAGLHPVIPQKGSVGASGDLAPLAHMAGAVCGFAEAEIDYQGPPHAGPRGDREAGFEPDFAGRQGSLGAHQRLDRVAGARRRSRSQDARRILKHADIALALSLEAMRGELAAFDPRVQPPGRIPGRPGRRATSAHLDGTEALLGGRARRSSIPDEPRAARQARRRPRVQDVYSLRCAPQVHGPVVEALDYVDGIIGTEINAATDNPLIFDDGTGGYVSISGGHFHGAVRGPGDGRPRHRHGRSRRHLGAPARAPHRSHA